VPIHRDTTPGNEQEQGRGKELQTIALTQRSVGQEKRKGDGKEGTTSEGVGCLLQVTISHQSNICFRNQDWGFKGEKRRS